MDRVFSISDYTYSRPTRSRTHFRVFIPEFTVAAGTVTSLIGPSGSGKSTIFDLLAGVTDDGIGFDVRRVFPKVAYLMHDTALVPWKTGVGNYLLECKLRNEPPQTSRFGELVQSCRLGKDASLKQVRELSFGMRQRMELARALAFDPDLLIVDEGLSGLDRRLKVGVFRVILHEVITRRMAVLLTSHFLTDVLTFSNRIYQINEGSVLAKRIDIDIDVSDRLAWPEVELLAKADIAAAVAEII